MLTLINFRSVSFVTALLVVAYEGEYFMMVLSQELTLDVLEYSNLFFEMKPIFLVLSRS